MFLEEYEDYLLNKILIYARDSIRLAELVRDNRTLLMAKKLFVRVLV